MILLINQFREYKKDHTDSRVYVDSEFFGYGLEDIGRPSGVKIQDETCIPEGVYKVAVTHSPAFKREMAILYNVDADHSVERSGVRFTGIRVHGGNNVDHTAGCLIVARNHDGKGKAWESLEADMLKIIKDAIASGKQVRWIISEGVE